CPAVKIDFSIVKRIWGSTAMHAKTHSLPGTSHAFFLAHQECPSDSVPAANDILGTSLVPAPDRTVSGATRRAHCPCRRCRDLRQNGNNVQSPPGKQRRGHTSRVATKRGTRRICFTREHLPG